MGEFGLVITRARPPTPSEPDRGRNWLFATDAYLYALAASMVPPDPLIIVLDYDKHLQQVQGTTAPALDLDLELYLEDYGVTYQFAYVMYSEGWTPDDDGPIHWRDPDFACALVFETTEARALGLITLP